MRAPRLEAIPLRHVHRYLEPGPVILIATADARGRANLMTAGFHMVVQHEPPLLGVIVGGWDHSLRALRQRGECVVAVPPATLAATVVDIGNCSGREHDKFAEFGLAALPAAEVEAPLVGGCIANFECRIADASLASRYDLFVLEAVRGWLDPALKDARTFHHRGDGTFVVDGDTLDLRERMVKWKQFQD
jgi:flavin reductase (DIM6/NTAB) family NADH-FMN oxidoreductase RutF